MTNKATDSDHIPCVISIETFHCVAEEERTAPLKARDYKDPIVIAYELSRNSGNADGVGISETRNAGSSE